MNRVFLTSSIIPKPLIKRFLRPSFTFGVEKWLLVFWALFLLEPVVNFKILQEVAWSMGRSKVLTFFILWLEVLSFWSYGKHARFLRKSHLRVVVWVSGKESTWVDFSKVHFAQGIGALIYEKVEIFVHKILDFLWNIVPLLERQIFFDEF